MPTIVSHGIVAAAGTRAALGERATRALVGFAVLGAMIPDADVISFALGIPYEHWLGHRGLSHSLLFAAAFGVGAARLLRWRHPEETARRGFGLDAFVIALATASHGFLDAFTNGGEGVGFFIPFDDTRHFFAWQGIEVSPIGRHFFSAEGLRVVISELTLLVAPALLVLLVTERSRRH